MAKQHEDRGRVSPSRLGRGLGSLIPVPIQRPSTPPGTTGSDPSGASTPRATMETVAPAPSAPRTAGQAPLSAPGKPSRAAVASPVPGAAPGQPQEFARAPDGATVAFLPIHALRPGKYQPRGDMDAQALDALARSIEASGLMQPVVVRPVRDEPGSYELIAGERRWRAMLRLNKAEIPAIVRSASDSEAAELGLIENLQREDLNPMDRASALRRLADDFGMTHQQLAERVGLERATISNLLRLNDLDSQVAAQVRSGAVSLGHAKALLGVTDVSRRRALADAIVAHDWSVRQLESEIKSRSDVPRGTARGKGHRGPAGSAHLVDLQRALEEHLGTRVQVRVGRKKGAGELRIQFFSLDEFDGLMLRIGFRGTDRITV